MKISLSFSSPSSSSTSSFDRNLCNTNSHNATAGCLSGVFRRLLCAGSLRTHPFDCMKEANGVGSETQRYFKSGEEKIEAAVSTPGVVARLMGLESMPDLNLVSTFRTSDSIGRSRSANSADYWSEFDPTQLQHQRIKSSLSFREVPTFLRKENDEFLVLSFENGGETKELRSNRRKCEMGLGESKQGSSDRCKRKENRKDQPVSSLKNKEDEESNKRNQNKNDKSEVSKICSGSSWKLGILEEVKDSSSVPSRKKNDFREPQKELSAGSKLETKKRKKKEEDIRSTDKNMEPECDSENCSPVSVLDLNDSLTEPETIVSDENSRRASSNSRRDLSLELAKSDDPSSNFNLLSIFTEIQESRQIKKQGVEGKRKDSHDHKQFALWGEACKLAEKETHASIWMPREMTKMEELEEIGTEFGLQILDRLVKEVAIDLAGFTKKNFVLY